jgi:PAS domain S-box-containing protein
MVAVLTEHEEARLAALRRLDILGTAPEPHFDMLVQLAAQICQTPIALLTLVAEEYQWFKARIGLKIESTARADSFCAHAILQPSITMVVEDTFLDHRFAANPLVTGDPHIRFYAGAPIITADGFPLGTLCTLDRTPRQLTPAQLEALKLLSQLAGNHLELHQHHRQHLAFFLSTLDRTGDGIALINQEGGVLYQNQTFEQLLGYSIDELNVTGALSRLFANQSDYHALLATMQADTIWQGELFLYTGAGEARPVELKVAPISAQQNHFAGYLCTLKDIADRRAAEESLRQSEMRFSKIFNASPVAISLIDATTGKCLEANERFLQLIERSREEVMGRSLFNLELWPALHFIPELMDSLQEQQSLSGCEIQLNTKQGRARTGLASLELLEVDGRPCVLAMIEDITERKRWENQLARQHKFEGALYQIGLDLLQRRDLDSLLQAIVENCAIALDAPLAELMLLEDDELVVRASTANLAHLRGEHVARWQARLSWQAYDTRRPVILDDYATWPYRRPTYQSVELHATADFPILLNERCIGVLALGRTAPQNVFTPDDEHRGIMFSQLAALALDNTLLYAEAQRELAERRQSEEALLASEEKYRSLVESTDSLLVMVDTRGCILYANRSAAHLFGMTPASLLGKLLAEISPLHMLTSLQADIQQVLTTNKGFTTEQTSTLGTANHWYRVSIQPIRDGSSSPVGVLINAVDISEHKEMEQSLQRRLMLEQLVAAISTKFISLSADRADEEIQQLVAALGEFAGADRSYLFRLADDGSVAANTHEWCVEGIEPFIHTMPEFSIADYSWSLGMILRNEVVHIPRVADLPAQAHNEKISFEAQSIQSLLIVPIFSKRGTIGYLGFDAVRRERSWSPEDIILLKLAGEVLASAFERWHVDGEIQELNRSLERRVAERTAETQRQASAMDATREGMAIIQQQCFVYVNRAYAELHGYSPDDLVGQEWKALYSADIHNSPLLRVNLRAGESWTGIATGRRKDGASFTVEVSLSANAHGLIVAERDVTARIQAELEVKQAEARYRSLFENAPVMYLTTRNMDGVPTITSCNKHLLATLGYSRDELVGQWLGTIYAPEAIDQMVDGYLRALTGVIVDEERRLRTRDGRILTTLLRARPEQDATGETIGTLAMFVDITALKQTEKRLRRLSEQLRTLAHYQESVREDERKSVARDIHDELGQMLTALKMDVVWLGKQLPGAEPRLLAKIDAMSQLVSMTIKSVQRISSELRPGLLDTLGLMAAVEWHLQEVQARSELTCRATGTVPQAVEVENGLKTALFRIFQEAVTNVIRHAQASLVEVRLETVGGLFRLTIQDDGIGIKPDKLSAPHSLGLIGMRERLHPWGGEIEFQQRVPSGTTVCVSVPYQV